MVHLALAAVIALGQAPTPSPPPTSQPEARLNAVRSRAWIPALIGGVLVAGGGLAIGVGRFQHASAMTLEPGIHEGRLNQAAYNTVGGVALVSLGACTLGLSAFMWKWESFSQVRFSLALDGRGGFFAFSGTLP
jgi:hypothetical protein